MLLDKIDISEKLNRPEFPNFEDKSEQDFGFRNDSTMAFIASSSLNKTCASLSSDILPTRSDFRKNCDRLDEILKAKVSERAIV